MRTVDIRMTKAPSLIQIVWYEERGAAIIRLEHNWNYVEFVVGTDAVLRRSILGPKLVSTYDGVTSNRVVFDPHTLTSPGVPKVDWRRI